MTAQLLVPTVEKGFLRVAFASSDGRTVSDHFGWGREFILFDVSKNGARKAGKMTFEDARKILHGSDTAATEYFQAHTSSRLSAAFRPIVERAMRENGVTRQYEALIGQYESLPFMKGPTFDINEYVVSQALNGLFYMLGEEEKKIRKNPAARVTSLLKEVFAKH